MPWFVDHHRHLPPTGAGPDEARRDLARARRDAIEAASGEGVGAFRDMGTAAPVAIGHPAATEVISAIRGIEGSRDPFAHRFAVPVSRRPDLERVVGENINLGARFVKIFASRSGLLPPRQATQPALSATQINDISALAREFSLPVVAHCQGGPMTAVAIHAEVTHLEHGLYLSRDELDGMAAAGVTLTLTVGVYLEKLGDPMVPRLRSLVGDVLASGVRFVIGTDGSRRGMAGELVALVGLGMGFSDALRAATSPLSPTSSESGRLIILREDPRRAPEALLAPLGMGSLVA